ncbi:CLUMA_CG001566, isoform A [Clunio marinus]|uniref:CLUMA_CG001566, isoform A n=1 Tax=Clunio marinus TaxID=568069 RepID=A0A1J1HIH0_9DIPT|nr:CLUMA_CG001566, isoform A [Clunio marinus]
MSSKNDREMHIAEMVTVEREIRANEIMKMFLGGKGKRRIMEPLESREVRRRDQFKLDHANRLNIYYEIINNIMKFTKTSNIVNSKNLFVRDENEGFQYYILFNFINNQLESFSNSLAKESTEIQASQDYFNNLMKFYDQKIEELRREFGEKVAQLLPLKNDREKLVSQLMQHLKTIEDVMKTLECDFSSVQKLLGDHKKITLLNIPEFFSLLEQRINEVLAFVFCDQRKNVDIFNDDKNLCVRSLKRSAEDFVKIEDVITTQQCAECAEREDINRYDETIVYPLDIETIKEKMREKIYSPDMLRRLHNLSKCNLPRSGIIASRRYVE